MLRFGDPKVQELLEAQAENNPDYEPPQRPELHEDLLDVWEIFLFLHSHRPSGFGPGALTVESIRVAFDFFRVSPSLEWSYLQILDALDAHYFSSLKDKKDA